MSKELKPCPFCGSHYIKREPWVIRCQNCNATYYGQPDNPPDVILKGWNCRAAIGKAEGDTAQDERIRELEKVYSWKSDEPGKDSLADCTERCYCATCTYLRELRRATSRKRKKDGAA